MSTATTQFGMRRAKPLRRRILKLASGVVFVCAAVGIGILGWYYAAPGPMDFAASPRVPLTEYRAFLTGAPPDFLSTNPIERGKYLAQAADCQACHTTEGGKPFAGGRAFKTQFGTLYSPNITPDPSSGIGEWTDAEFLNAVHNGVSRNGQNLYPAFPYASYTYLVDEDVLAIRRYLATVPAVKTPDVVNDLRFPFNQRALMGIWKALFNPAERFMPAVRQTAEWNRGAYLVEALGHCGDCHTQRNLLQALDNRSKFGGAIADGWKAFNITSDKTTGIGAWTDEQLIAYLGTAHAEGRGTASGPMAEAIDLSLSKLTAGDLTSIVTYLRSIPPVTSPDAGSVKLEASQQGFNPATSQEIGQKLFAGACASCHGSSGNSPLSSRGTLIGARSVNDPSGINVAQVILHGAGIHPKAGRLDMPRFGEVYSDAEIAALANFVTARFGTSPTKITPDDVGAMR
jgi:mono/diheme cytochrome c family protein